MQIIIITEVSFPFELPCIFKNHIKGVNVTTLAIYSIKILNSFSQSHHLIMCVWETDLPDHTGFLPLVIKVQWHNISSWSIFPGLSTSAVHAGIGAYVEMCKCEGHNIQQPNSIYF